MQHLRLLIVLLLPAVFIMACAETPEEPPVPASASARASADWVMFASGRSGEGDLYALQPETGETRLVVGTPSPEGTVRYDAARDRLVYHRYETDPERAVLVADSTDLFVCPNGDVAPVWSPTGTRIAYVAQRDGQDDLFLARPDGSEEQRLTNDAFIDRYPAWSPDGDRLVFARRLDTGWDLHVLDLTTDPPTLGRLTNDGVYVGHPAWSPDGQFIAFDTLIEEQAEIVMLELATGTLTRLTDRPGNDLIPAWSPDSRRIAFGGEPNSNGNWDLWMVDVTTREITRLTTQPTYDGGPVFVPATVVEQYSP